MMVVGSRLSTRFLPGRHRTDCVIIVSSQGLRFSGVVIRHRASWPLGRTVLETVERFKWPRAIEAMTRYICWLAGWLVVDDVTASCEVEFWVSVGDSRVVGSFPI